MNRSVIACACADIPGAARSTVMFGLMMPIVLALLFAAVLTVVCAVAWTADRLLRRPPAGVERHDTDAPPPGAPAGPPSDTEPEARSGLDEFTWTEEHPAGRPPRRRPGPAHPGPRH
ncbi:hypothetical protein [Streptomyces sp. NPDC088812]|uniref:hypothetical protein n=1 Tax=Streptomyces sp. NPDC088812 TaxID=3365905 RepID=UPI00380164E9